MGFGVSIISGFQKIFSESCHLLNVRKREAYQYLLTYLSNASVMASKNSGISGGVRPVTICPSIHAAHSG